MTPTPTYAWAIKAPDGTILSNHVADTIDRLKQTTLGWDIYERHGLRCVRVQITELPEVQE